jgi:hypothetical protein
MTTSSNPVAVTSKAWKWNVKVSKSGTIAITNTGNNWKTALWSKRTVSKCRKNSKTNMLKKTCSTRFKLEQPGLRCLKLLTE